MNSNKLIFILFYLLLFTISTPVLLGFLNFMHPLFDSFSHFRIHLLYMILPLIFILALLHKNFYRIIYFLLLLSTAFYLYLLSQPFKPLLSNKEKVENLKHMQFNLNFRNHKMDKVSQYIVDHPMDIITLQEVTKEHQEALEELETENFAVEFSTSYPYIGQKKGPYPYQAYCNFRAIGAVAILSKHPFETKPVCTDGLIWAKVLIKEKPINVLSTHLYWPYPHHQNEQVQQLLPLLEGIDSPLMISGDFNAVPWSHTMQEIAHASNTKVVLGLRWSIKLNKQLPLLPFMKLPLDHLLISNEFEVKQIKVEKSLGSDHLPIVSELSY